MILNFDEYNKVFADKNIILMYNGPLWSDGIYSMATMFRQYLDLDGQPSNASVSIFAVFIEQLNNMMIHSAEKIRINHPNKEFSESPKGSFIVGLYEKSYHMQAGNTTSRKDAEILKNRIDYLNSLNKNELLKEYKEKVKAESENPEGKGAGIGLTEIAWRAASKIEYRLTEKENGLLYFTTYIIV